MIRVLIVAVVALFIWLLSSLFLKSKIPEQLTLGYSQEAPYAYLDKHAELKGVYVWASQKVASTLGIKKVEWVLHDFFQLFGSLQQKRINIIAAGLTITPERAESLCFTEPLLQADSALLVLENSTIANFSDDGRLKIAVIANSVEHKILAEKHYDLLVVASADEGVTAVLAQNATALALTKPTLIELSQRFSGKFKLAELNGVPAIEHHSAFAMHKDDVGLIKYWNKAQRKLQQQPDFKASIENLGFNMPELPDTITEHCYAA